MDAQKFDDRMSEWVGADYVVVRAEENGVNVIGLTRGPETRFSHTEKLDEGEVWISQFTENTSAVKVRGAATIYSKHGVVRSGRS